MTDVQHFYSVALIGLATHDHQPVKSRWLRRTLHYTCAACGHTAPTQVGGTCEVGQQQMVSSAASTAMEGVVRELQGAGHEVPWKDIRLQVDHDILRMADRVIAQVKVQMP